jgi:hypothetical protein
MICGFWLPLWYLLSYDLRLLITPLGSSVLWLTASDYPFGIFCPMTYGFWLPLWYLLSYDLRLLITPLGSSVLWFAASDYPFGIFSPMIYGFWLPLRYLLSYVLRLLITSLVSSVLWLTASDYPFGIFCPMIYGFWLPVSNRLLSLVSSVTCVQSFVIPGFVSDLCPVACYPWFHSPIKMTDMKLILFCICTIWAVNLHWLDKCLVYTVTDQDISCLVPDSCRAMISSISSLGLHRGSHKNDRNHALFCSFQTIWLCVINSIYAHCLKI